MRAMGLLLIVLLAGCAGASGSREPSASLLPSSAWTPSAVPLSTMHATATPVSPRQSASPRSTTKPTPGVPPKPSGVTFELREKDIGGDRIEKTATITWRSPRNPDVEIKIYGVIECLSKPTAAPIGAHGPCLVEHTPLPSGVLRLATTAAASDGRASWTWIEDWSGPGCQWYPPVSGPDGSWYEAVVLSAYDASGHSIFAIANPGSYWVGDLIC